MGSTGFRSISRAANNIVEVVGKGEYLKLHVGQLRTDSTIYPQRRDCTPSPQTPACVERETRPSSRQDQGQTIRTKRPFKNKNDTYQLDILLSHNVYYVNFKKYPDRQLPPRLPFWVPKAIGTTQTAYLHLLPLRSLRSSLQFSPIVLDTASILSIRMSTKPSGPNLMLTKTGNPLCKKTGAHTLCKNRLHGRLHFLSEKRAGIVVCARRV